MLGELVEAARQLAAPTSPTALFACAATDLPPPGAWPQGLLLVRDLNILAHSDGVRWIRSDTGGAI
ncbi:MAG: hypothetical protein CFE28_12650 [Alphaproteobacteria bacterium PA2]|nr:MAG: hypothetical protein CFE28_12650 [Alphaproteobacteria bacterium PA2]